LEIPVKHYETAAEATEAARYAQARARMWARISMAAMILALVVLLVFALAGCGDSNKLREGEAIRLDYDDPDIITTINCVAYTNGYCSAWVPISYPDPAHWSVTIRAPYGDDDKPRTEVHRIPESFWNDIQLGDWVNLDAMEVTTRS
jgi:hypothetical protein